MLAAITVAPPWGCFVPPTKMSALPRSRIVPFFIVALAAVVLLATTTAAYACDIGCVGSIDHGTGRSMARQPQERDAMSAAPMAAPTGDEADGHATSCFAGVAVAAILVAPFNTAPGGAQRALPLPSREFASVDLAPPEHRPKLDDRQALDSA